MKYACVHLSVPFAGCYEEYYIACPDDFNLDDYCDSEASSLGESYEHMVYWDFDEDEVEENEELEKALDDYWCDTYGRYELVTKEEWKENYGIVIK